MMENKKPYPKRGEVFELTIDGDAPENQPLAMVKKYGYNHPEDWRHNGQTVKGKQTRRFMLVSVDYCANWKELTEKLSVYGPTPEGQWIEAFRSDYETDGNRPVGVADASWVGPSGYVHFPGINKDGSSAFGVTGGGFSADFWWLVPVN